MKSQDISAAIKGFKICKICGAENSYGVTKYKQTIKKPRGTKNIVNVQNDKIFITEEGPYKVWISDEILDVKENTYSINAVKDYIFEQVIFRLSLVCPSTNVPKQDSEWDPFRNVQANEDGVPDESTFHYEAVFQVSVDQKSKEILDVYCSSEWLENDEFSINKNFSNNTTKIMKKSRGLQLPFIYDKDFKDFDFNKLITISNLLK